MDILVSGTIVQSLGIQSGVGQKSGQPWSKATYVIEHEHGQYPKKMVFDVRNNKIQELNLQVGESVQLHLNVDINEYNGRLFNNIECWKVDRQVQQQAIPQGGYVQQPQMQQQMQQGYQQVQSPLPPQQPMQQPMQQMPPQQVQNPFPPQPAPGQAIPPQGQQGNGTLPF